MAEGEPTEPGKPQSSGAAGNDGAGAVYLCPGDRVGPYLIREQIGEGGFALVYSADQEKPVRRRVALKIIKLGMDTRQVIGRFESERQVLARMSHPHVAMVFDAGTTKDGRPYFVMELVHGEPITDYCDRHRLSISERLGLIINVAEAIHHAHQKGIIHRDVKPSNVLVAIDGDHHLPKVIDFGIAKATTAGLTEQTVFTEQGQLIGTPEYMSPEQAEMTGLNVDTRTDIYSLGVLLYELLTGSLPFDPRILRQAGLIDIQRVIREQEPPKPSTRLSGLEPDDSSQVATRRRTTSSAMLRELRGDLDWIVMKAMEKDRTRRYASATDLARDLQRYLRHEPVDARPPTATYRARKLVRRHKVASAAVASCVLALLVGTVTTSWQAVRANQKREQAAQRFGQVRELANSLIFEVYDRIVELPGATDARDFIVSQGIRYLDALGRDAGDDIGLIEDLQAGWHRVADLQGGGVINLGHFEAARRSYARSRELLDVLLESDPSSVGYRYRLADLLLATVILAVQEGRHRDSRADVDRVLEVVNALASERPDDQRVQLLIAKSHSVIAHIEEIHGRRDSAVAHSRLCLEQVQPLLAADPSDADLRANVAEAHASLSRRLWAANDIDDAFDHSAQSEELFRELIERFPNNARYRVQLSQTRVIVVRVMLAREDFDAALAVIDESVELARSLVATDARNAQAQNDLLILLTQSAGLLYQYAANETRPVELRLRLYEACLANCNLGIQIFERLERDGTLDPRSGVNMVVLYLHVLNSRRGIGELQASQGGP